MAASLKVSFLPVPFRQGAGELQPPQIAQDHVLEIAGIRLPVFIVFETVTVEFALCQIAVILRFAAVLDAVGVDEKVNCVFRFDDFRALHAITVEMKIQRQRTRLRIFRNRQITGNRTLAGSGNLDVINPGDFRFPDEFLFLHPHRNGGQLRLRLPPERIEVGRFGDALLERFRGDAGAEAELHRAGAVRPGAVDGFPIPVEQHRLDHHEAGLIERGAADSRNARLRLHIERLRSAVVAVPGDAELSRRRPAVFLKQKEETHLLAGPVPDIGTVGVTGDRAGGIIRQHFFGDGDIAEAGGSDNPVEPEHDRRRLQVFRDLDGNPARRPVRRTGRGGDLRHIPSAVFIDQLQRQPDAVPRVRSGRNVHLGDFTGERHRLPRQQRGIDRNVHGIFADVRRRKIQNCRVPLSGEIPAGPRLNLLRQFRLIKFLTGRKSRRGQQYSQRK